MGLKIPRSKGRAGSIPASGTKQIKGLHAFGVQALCFLFRKKMGCSEFLIGAPPVSCQRSGPCWSGCLTAPTAPSEISRSDGFVSLVHALFRALVLVVHPKNQVEYNRERKEYSGTCHAVFSRPEF